MTTTKQTELLDNYKDVVRDVVPAARQMLAALEQLDEGLTLSERLCGLSAGAKKQQAMIRAAIGAAIIAGIKAEG